jgi:PleD family two-component response regulator
MTKFGNSPTEIIKSKIENMNNLLQTVVDGLPAISLSVGVAFSEEGFVDSLVEQADSALYKVKKGGRCNCSFYEEIES